jgi:hypothetical protein
MGSVRLSPDLDDKVRRVAAKKRLTRSDVFRQALEEYCAAELEPARPGRYDDVIGVVDGPPDGSVRVGERFTEGMSIKYG